MVHQRLPLLNRRGFTAVELIVVMAIIGVLAAFSIPNLITYYQASTLKAGAEELVTVLNRGRQLAITQNRSVCVHVPGNSSQYRYRLGGCSGDVWLGPGTPDNGFYRLTNNVRFAADTNVVFDYLGSANPGATFTVIYINRSGTPGASRTVVVSPSGRIQIP